MSKGAFISTMIIVLIILCGAGVGVMFFMMNSAGGSSDIESQLKENIQSNIISLLASMSSVSFDYMVDEDDMGFSELFEPAVKTDKNIKYIYAINKDGVVIGTTEGENEIGRRVSNPEITLKNSDKYDIEWKGNDLYVYYPIENIGGLYLKYTLPPVQTSNNTPIIPMAIGFGIVLIGGILITIILGLKIPSATDEEEFVGISSERVQQLRREEQEVQKKIEEKKNQLKEIENQIEEKNKEKTEIETALAGFEEKKKELESFNSQKEGLERVIKELEDKKESLMTEIANLKKEHETVAQNPEVQNLETRIESLKKEASVLIETIKKYKEESIRLAKEIEEKKKQLAATASSSSIDMEKRKAEEVALTQRIITKRREEIALSQRIEMKKKKEQELEKRLQLLVQKIKKLEKGNQ